jgi:hypothetical protein
VQLCSGEEPHLRLTALEAGRNVKQVQEWLGHVDPGFTLRTYVHLMDAGVGGADFLDEAVAAPSGNGDRIAVNPA